MASFRLFERGVLLNRIHMVFHSREGISRQLISPCGNIFDRKNLLFCTDFQCSLELLTGVGDGSGITTSQSESFISVLL